MEKKEEKDCIENGYKHVECLTDKENGPVLVRNNQTQKFWVKKEYPSFLTTSLETLQQIQHKNLPKIEELVVEENKVFLYEEYIHGKTLSELIYSSDAMAGKDILALAQSILEALEALHEHGLIHRDIKPSNIMLTNDQTVKLIDFDAVRRISGDKESDTVQLGTVGFAAPEQFGFAESDARSDLFSLGVVMNVCSTRDYPKNQLTDDLLIQEIVTKATKIDPDVRYQNATEMKAAVAYQLNLAETSVESGAGEQTNSSVLLEETNQEQEAEPEFSEEDVAHVADRKWKRPLSLTSVIEGLLRVLRHIPGFRTKQLWKMFLAITGYVVLGIIATYSSSYEDTFEMRVRWVIDCFFIFLLPVLLYANFLDFHRYLSFFQSSSIVKKGIGYIFLTFVWAVLFLFYGVILRPISL